MTYWKFETENWAGDYYSLKEKPTLDKLWPYLKQEEWNGQKHNYRVLDVPGTDDVEVQSNLSCGRPCEWRTAQIIRRYG